MHTLCPAGWVSKNRLVDAEQSLRRPQHLQDCRISACSRRTAPELRSRPDIRDVGTDSLSVVRIDAFLGVTFGHECSADSAFIQPKLILCPKTVCYFSEA